MSNFRDWAKKEKPERRRRVEDRARGRRRSSFPTQGEAEAYAESIRKYSQYTREHVVSVNPVGRKWVVITEKR